MYSKYLKSNYSSENTYDVDSEELLTCLDMGYKSKEIASELKIPLSEVEDFKNKYFN